MSDFDNIIAAPTPELYEERGMRWTLTMLMKWRTVGLNEHEAFRLLFLWNPKTLTPSTIRQRLRERNFEERGKLNGLAYAALVFEKDARTIRRWCENKLIPGAKRTKGGHWRISLRGVEEFRKLHPSGFGRKPKRIFGTEAWKKFKKELPVIFGQRIWEAMAMEAALQDKAQSEFMAAPIPFTSEALDVLKIAIDTKQNDYSTLRLLARRLLKEDPHRRLNYKLLADALRIHPSTLYRRYTASEIKSAIKGSSKSLRESEAEIKEARGRQLTDAEQDVEAIRNWTGQVEVEGNTHSPYLHSQDREDS